MQSISFFYSNTATESYHIRITLRPAFNKSGLSGLFLPTHINLEQIPDAAMRQRH